MWGVGASGFGVAWCLGQGFVGSGRVFSATCDGAGAGVLMSCVADIFGVIVRVARRVRAQKC